MPGVIASALGAATAAMRSPLTRNGYALVASTAVTSVLGLVFWVLAARFYPAEQIGLGSVLISTMVTLSSASQLNFGNVLNRFVPVAGARAGRLILIAYGSAAAAAVAISGGFLLVAGLLMPGLAFLTGDPVLSFVFAVAVMTWSIFALQDSALAALRKAVWIPLENTLYSIAKIVLLVIFAGFSTVGLSIFASWILPLLAIVAAMNLFIFAVVLKRDRPPASTHADLSPRAMARFFGWDYVGGLAMTAAMGIAPLLVLSNGGLTASANYHLAWTITYSLYLIGRSMGISLLAESSADPHRAPSLAADAVVHTMLPLVAAALGIALGAPLLMAIFGPTYVEEGTTLLRVLALSSIPWGLVTIFLAIARARGWMLAIVVTQAATLGLLLCLGTFLLTLTGPLGIGVAWLATHTLVAMGIAAAAVFLGGRDRAIEWLLNLASSLARFASPFLGWRSGQTSPLVLGNTAASALLQIDEPGASGWRPAGGVHSQSDSSIQFLGVPGEPPAVVVKTARTEQGMAALQRGNDRLERLRGDARTSDCGFDLPRLLAQRRTAEGLVAIEAAIPGEDGRVVLRRSEARATALAAVARALTLLHHRTSVQSTIDEDWIVRWLDHPEGQMNLIAKGLGHAGRRGAWLRAFVTEQRAFWIGRTAALGVSHGDLSPGNVIFAPTRANNGTPEPVRLAAIIDWDASQDDAPTGFDICHLLITSRMLLWDRELGLVVGDLLRNPQWNADELACLDAAEANGEWARDPLATKAMIGFVWLHHVAANIEKSERYRANRLWVASNVDWALRTYTAERDLQ
jgi:O-antigen/teichoic acid export membrane protein